MTNYPFYTPLVQQSFLQMISLPQYGHAKIGHQSTQLNGCYATHIVLLPGTHVVKLPENVPSNTSAPLNCALATMVNATTCVPTRMKSAALIQVFLHFKRKRLLITEKKVTVNRIKAPWYPKRF